MKAGGGGAGRIPGQFYAKIFRPMSANILPSRTLDDLRNLRGFLTTSGISFGPSGAQKSAHMS